MVYRIQQTSKHVRRRARPLPQESRTKTTSRSEYHHHAEYVQKHPGADAQHVSTVEPGIVQRRAGTPSRRKCWNSSSSNRGLTQIARCEGPWKECPDFQLWTAPGRDLVLRGPFSLRKS